MYIEDKNRFVILWMSAISVDYWLTRCGSPKNKFAGSREIETVLKERNRMRIASTISDYEPFLEGDHAIVNPLLVSVLVPRDCPISFPMWTIAGNETVDTAKAHVWVGEREEKENRSKTEEIFVARSAIQHLSRFSRAISSALLSLLGFSKLQYDRKSIIARTNAASPEFFFSFTKIIKSLKLLVECTLKYLPLRRCFWFISKDISEREWALFRTTYNGRWKLWSIF